MARYFNKKTKCEAIPGFHDICADCVELPEGHAFWRALPPGSMLDYDADGLPVVVPFALNDEQKAFNEIKWRNAEIDKVARTLDQIRNDEGFGTSSYKGSATAAELNTYRVALCEYPSHPNFPNTIRPSLVSLGG